MCAPIEECQFLYAVCFCENSGKKREEGGGKLVERVYGERASGLLS